ncbi:glucooligosaccharide oxidase [Lyophyllum atratum]|nr:glucooligosaccharide oxidase [Lyophyllum atratum]
MLGINKLLFLFVTSSSCFAADVRGSLESLGIIASFPGDATYASASSPFNLRFAFQPAAITYPKNIKEISEIVEVGGAAKLSVVARSGGHSYIANGLGGRDGALVVDLSNFGNITIDSTRGTAVVETGNRLGDIAAALGKAGRGLPHGSCAYVGIGGHAAFGGFGFASRMWGLTLDTITALNVVLANGTIARVTNQNHPDLFWALRGSASSFGIVTAIEVKTFPAPPTGTIFQYSWDGLNTTTATLIISAIQRFVKESDIPPQLGGEINLFRGAVIGTISISFAGGWYLPIEKLNATVNPLLRRVPAPSRTSFFTGTYLETAENLAGGSLDTKSAPDGHDTFYAKSLLTPDSSPMSDAAILAYTTYLANQGFSAEVGWFIQMELYGGRNSAINAVSLDATAFAHRRSIFSIQFYSSAPNNVPPYPQSGFTFLDGLVNSITSNSPSHWPYGAYPNYIDDKLSDWRIRYYGTHFTRLRSLKAKYDPSDIFDFPTSIDE